MGLSYLTVARAGEAEIEVKRSRFLCTLRRVTTESDARAVVERLRKDHWDARHHCSAFILGPPPQPVERSSDDGEPAGTAGAPMLDVLRGAQVSDTIAVVTRWFGGTLLGAGGLVRAYSDAVRTALDAVGTLRRELRREYRLTASYDAAGRLETELRNAGVTMLATTYDTDVTLDVAASPDDEPRLQTLVAELTGGRSVLAPGADRWVDTVVG